MSDVVDLADDYLMVSNALMRNWEPKPQGLAPSRRAQAHAPTRIEAKQAEATLSGVTGDHIRVPCWPTVDCFRTVWMVWLQRARPVRIYHIELITWVPSHVHSEYDPISMRREIELILISTLGQDKI